MNFRIRKGRVYERANYCGRRQQLVYKPQPLCSQFGLKEIKPCDVAFRSVNIPDKAELDWVGAHDEYDWNSRGCFLCCEWRRFAADGGDNRHLTAHQIGG